MPTSSVCGRIAIFYPWHRLGGLSCLLDATVMLAQHGYWVEIYTLWDSDFPSYVAGHPSISIITDRTGVFAEAGVVLPQWTFGRGYRLYSWLVSRLYRPMWRYFQFRRRLCEQHASQPYTCFIGMDPQGLIDAVRFADMLGVPFVYWSLELYFQHEVTEKQRNLKRKDTEYSRRAALTIVQDKWRAEALIAENGMDSGKVMLVPNAPMGRARRVRSNTLRTRLRIPAERKIVLLTGTLEWWTMGTEIVAAANSWPEEYVLVIQSARRSKSHSPYVDSMLNKADPKHVLFSFEPVPANEYRDLIDSADAGLAFYNPYPPATNSKSNTNIALIGLSSGKLAAYLYSGLPVVVNNITGPQELVEGNRCGISVSKPTQILGALNTIFEHYDWYSDNACLCFDDQLELTRNFLPVIDRLDMLSPRQNGPQCDCTKVRK